jgi:hypothetical protein
MLGVELCNRYPCRNNSLVSKTFFSFEVADFSDSWSVQHIRNDVVSGMRETDDNVTYPNGSAFASAHLKAKPLVRY